MISNEPKRVLFYVQHLLGIGHVRRAALIAAAIADSGMACHVVLGGSAVSGINWGAAITHDLPPVLAADQSFSRYLTSDNTEPDEDYWADRQSKLMAVVDDIQPDVVMIEQFPFGRRKFRHEIVAMIKRAKALKSDTRIAGSVRDVLVGSHRSDKARFAVDILKRDFDVLLVHGDPAFIPFAETFPLAAEIEDLIRYTGYVAPPAPKDALGNGDVIVSAGGGAVGGNLLRVAMQAREQGLLAAHHWRFLTGPNLPSEEIDWLKAVCPANVTIEPNRPDYPSLLRGAALSISQAGYNTLMDIVRAGCPALVVPFAAEGETEQMVRAKRLATISALTLLEEKDLSPDRLNGAAHEAVSALRPTKPLFSLDGAERSAALISELLGR